MNPLAAVNRLIGKVLGPVADPLANHHEADGLFYEDWTDCGCGLPDITPPHGLEATEYRHVDLQSLNTDIQKSESVHYPLSLGQMDEGNTTEERR